MAMIMEKPLLSSSDNLSGEPLLNVDGLSVSFLTRHGLYPAVRDLSFCVQTGQLLAVVGESGSGKSVTGKALLGLVEPPGRITTGRVLLAGEDILTKPPSELLALRGRIAGMVFQDAATSFDQVFTIGYQMTESITAHGMAAGRQARELALRWLARVGFNDCERIFHSYPLELSGGMKQRAYIAMVMSTDPRLLIADEPTTALDMLTQHTLITLLKELQMTIGCSIILITHDLGLVASIADQVLVMYAGQAVEQGPVAQVLSQPGHPYTMALIRCLDWSRRRGELRTIPGQPLAMNNLSEGCSFASRCGFVTAMCTESPPSLKALPGRLCRCHHPLWEKSKKLAIGRL